jgi:hypothetical protein
MAEEGAVPRSSFAASPEVEARIEGIVSRFLVVPQDQREAALKLLKLLPLNAVSADVAGHLDLVERLMGEFGFASVPAPMHPEFEGYVRMTAVWLNFDPNVWVALARRGPRVVEAS